MKCDKKGLLLYAVTDRSWLNGETLYSQVEKAASPRKKGSPCHAERNASCAASSASSGVGHIRTVRA